MGTVFNRRKLVELQVANNLTQSDLAKVIKIGVTQCNKKLRGIADFKESEICKLSDFFKVSPSIFFTQSVDDINT